MSKRKKSFLSFVIVALILSFVTVFAACKPKDDGGGKKPQKPTQQDSVTKERVESFLKKTSEAGKFYEGTKEKIDINKPYAISLGLEVGAVLGEHDLSYGIDIEALIGVMANEQSGLKLSVRDIKANKNVVSLIILDKEDFLYLVTLSDEFKFTIPASIKPNITKLFECFHYGTKYNGKKFPGVATFNFGQDNFNVTQLATEMLKTTGLDIAKMLKGTPFEEAGQSGDLTEVLDKLYPTIDGFMDERKSKKEGVLAMPLSGEAAAFNLLSTLSGKMFPPMGYNGKEKVLSPRSELIKEQLKNININHLVLSSKGDKPILKAEVQATVANGKGGAKENLKISVSVKFPTFKKQAQSSVKAPTNAKPFSIKTTITCDFSKVAELLQINPEAKFEYEETPGTKKVVKIKDLLEGFLGNKVLTLEFALTADLKYEAIKGYAILKQGTDILATAKFQGHDAAGNEKGYIDIFADMSPFYNKYIKTNPELDTFLTLEMDKNETLMYPDKPSPGEITIGEDKIITTEFKGLPADVKGFGTQMQKSQWKVNVRTNDILDGFINNVNNMFKKFDSIKAGSTDTQTGPILPSGYNPDGQPYFNSFFLGSIFSPTYAGSFMYRMTSDVTGDNGGKILWKSVAGKLFPDVPFSTVVKGLTAPVDYSKAIYTLINQKMFSTVGDTNKLVISPKNIINGAQAPFLDNEMIKYDPATGKLTPITGKDVQKTNTLLDYMVVSSTFRPGATPYFEDVKGAKVRSGESGYAQKEIYEKIEDRKYKKVKKDVIMDIKAAKVIEYKVLVPVEFDTKTYTVAEILADKSFKAEWYNFVPENPINTYFEVKDNIYSKKAGAEIKYKKVTKWELQAPAAGKEFVETPYFYAMPICKEQIDAIKDYYNKKTAEFVTKADGSKIDVTTALYEMEIAASETWTKDGLDLQTSITLLGGKATMNVKVESVTIDDIDATMATIDTSAPDYFKMKMLWVENGFKGAPNDDLSNKTAKVVLLYKDTF